MDKLAQYHQKMRRWEQQYTREPLAWHSERGKYIDLLHSGRFEEFWFLASDAHPLVCSLFEASDDFLEFHNDIRMSATRKYQFCMSLYLHCDDDAFFKTMLTSGAFDRIISSCFIDKPFSKLTEEAKKAVIDMSLRTVEIPAGTFIMGALEWDAVAEPNEGPTHTVTITRGFRMGVYPCTQGLYAHVMGEEPGVFKGARRPVENISACDVVMFCNRLSELKGLEPCYILPDDFEKEPRWSDIERNPKANGYRLPIEAEWEYAARANQKFIFSGSNHIEEVGWCYQNSSRQTHPVGMKRPNDWGLYDMCGNVWEWVHNTNTSRGVVSTAYRSKCSSIVRRGGSWYGSARVARTSFRGMTRADRKYSHQGFRFVRSVPRISRF